MNERLSQPASDDDITPEELHAANAVIFLNGLKTNKDLKGKWEAKLAKARDPKINKDDKIALLDNFLAKYNTTAEDVLRLLKEQWWIDYVNASKPNLQSDRFVQDVIQDTALYKKYQALATAGDMPAMDQWLQGKGYDCTTEQVVASFQKMRNQKLVFWTGLYGQTALTLQKTNGDGSKGASPAEGEKSAATSSALPKFGPPLLVNLKKVSIGLTELIDIDYSAGTLKWEGGAGSLNDFSGNIVFSQVNQPEGSSADDYSGPIFSGTITLPDDITDDITSGVTYKKGTYSYIGRVGEMPDDPDGHSLPPSVTPQQKDTVQQVFFWVGGLVGLGFGIQMLITVFKGGVGWTREMLDRFKKRADKELKNSDETTKKIPEDKIQETVDSLKDPAKVKDEGTIRELERQISEAGDPEEQARLQKQVTETRREMETQKEAEDDWKETEEDIGPGGEYENDLTDIMEW
ncbi:hypothetical protein ACH429_25810 [Streptomyces pathocidini]|uniref:Uncharacterized protein n=1 Tax=Streptomyces pathocidini TaxID=1650571 RepID=A0ABW7V037_9ACTN|nr:hypothetical protein [Streptomyces pathocidini]